MIMATDDATLNTGNKNSNHKRKTREEIERKLRDWAESRLHEKLISIGRCFFFQKRGFAALLQFATFSRGLWTVFFSNKDIWIVRKSEGGGETKSIENERPVFIWVNKGKVQIIMTNPYFSFVRVRVFLKKIYLFPDSSGHVTHCFDILGQGRFYLNLTIHDGAINQF